LARERLVDATQLRRRAEEALPDYVGNLDRIKTSIDIACRLVAAEVELKTDGPSTAKANRQKS
jgi:hypothetical protein